MNSRNSLLIVLEAESPRSGCQHSWMRALFWVIDFLLKYLDYFHMVEGTRELYGISFIRHQFQLIT